MNKVQDQQQQQALDNLLNLREDIPLLPQRLKSNNDDRENPIQGYEQRCRKLFRKKKNQKENESSRKLILPRLNNSKEELKLILRNLQDNDKCQAYDMISSKQNRQNQLKQLKISNRPQHRHIASKSNTIQSIHKKNIMRGEKVINRLKQQQNGLSMFQKSGDEVLHYLLRKNNYSANELNIKALKILHVIRLNRSRCETSLRDDKNTKLYNNNEHKKHLIGFIKKAR